VKVEWVTVGPFQENSYLLTDSGHGVLVDPGDEPERILEMVRRSGAAVDAIWLTHAHIDHIGAIPALKREWGSKVPVLLHPADLTLYRRASRQAEFYGLSLEQPADPDGEIAEGMVLTVGAAAFVARHTPGHAPGHVVFLGDRVMIGGDLLFAGSIGRTDLPFSDPDAMDASLALVSGFDPETAVYPGHGPPTRIGIEVAGNPYLVGVNQAH
jgi:glyoxylase-like metal-dependent hydrolase (beta-lactamase superfamily II)